MMIMRWCSLQTNEHDLQAIMYPIICKYHRLNINNGNRVPVFPGYICNRWQNMIVQPSQTHNHGKIWQQWERWILPIWWIQEFRFKKMHFKMSSAKRQPSCLNINNGNRVPVFPGYNADLDNGLSPEQRQASIQSRPETAITFQNI